MPSPTVSPPPPVPLLRPDLPLWAVVALACLASFMVVMDGSIVNVALAAMRRDLQLSPAQQHWVIDAYLLTFGGCMLLAARAGDLWGRRPVLQAGLALFGLASLAGGLAGNAAGLLAARAVQGIGASVLATSSMAIVVAATHHDRQARARAMSLWAALNSAGFAFGVVIGGVLTDFAGWRWVMFVNVPVSLALMAGAALCLRATPARGAAPQLDLPGALCATLGSSALVFGMTQSAALGWSSPTVMGTLAAGAALMALFVRVESRSAHPLVRLSLLRVQNVSAGSLLMLFLGATLAASVYLIANLLQQVGGHSAHDTGLAMLPMGVALAAARLVFAGPLARGAGRRLPFLGAVLAASGLAWMACLSSPPGAFAVLAPTLLVGAGLGLVILSATQAVTGGVQPQDAGMVSGLSNTARHLGGALGVAGVGTLCDTVARAHPAGLPASLALLQGHQAAFAAAAGVSLLCGVVSLSLRDAK